MTSCLLIDDHPGFTAVARRLLESEGIDVVGTATTAAEGMALARRLRPSIALVDVELGEESGLDLARTLATDDETRGTTVVLMSGRSRHDLGVVLDEVTDAGFAAGFVAKDQLSAAVLVGLTSGGGRSRTG